MPQRVFVFWTKGRTDLVEEIAARGHLHEEVPCGEVSSPLRLVDGELCSADELEDVSVLERSVHPTLLLHGLHLPVREVGRDGDDFACGDAVALRVHRLVYSVRDDRKISGHIAEEQRHGTDVEKPPPPICFTILKPTK